MQNGNNHPAAEAADDTLSEQPRPLPRTGFAGTGLTGSEGTDGAAALTVLSHPKEKAERFHLPTAEDVTLLLGRGSGADLDLDDTRVSRRHAQITVRGGRHFIEDLGSVAGTEVNGSAVKGSVELRHGDRIRAGTTGLVYSAAGEEPIRRADSDSDDTETAIPRGVPLPSLVAEPSADAQASYRRALTAVVGLIAMILAWMFLETF